MVLCLTFIDPCSGTRDSSPKKLASLLTVTVGVCPLVPTSVHSQPFDVQLALRPACLWRSNSILPTTRPARCICLLFVHSSHLLCPLPRFSPLSSFPLLHHILYSSPHRRALELSRRQLRGRNVEIGGYRDLGLPRR